MASGWVKSLQCKSRAFDDVYHPNPNPKHLLLPSASCRNTAQSVIESATKHKKHSSKPNKAPNRQNPISKNPRPELPVREGNIALSRTSGTIRNREPFVSALAELPEGHPSRNVVEIIFHTSWSPGSFTGRIDLVFKIQNGSKTVARFEEYREIVKARAVSDGLDGGANTWEENARCVADGNEVMRFYCLGAAGGPYDPSCGGAWKFSVGKGKAICTFSGGGWAHESAGGGRGRRAMLVCRVIAGRVSNRVGFDLNGRVGFDSVYGENDEELLVFDSRAVLPCFLIIYKL